MRTEFHPLTILLYHVIGFVLVFLVAHPVLLLIAVILMLISGLLESESKGSLLSIRGVAGYCIFFVLIVFINILFNHRGEEVLGEPFGIRITKEALVYGIALGMTFIICMLIFSSFSRRMDDRKIMSLIGGRLPGFALVFSMTLRLIPCLRRDVREYKKINGHGLRCLKSVFTKTLDDGIIRSISMKDRGYEGLNHRTCIYKKKLTANDFVLVVMSLLVLLLSILFKLFSGYKLYYFPVIHIESIPWYMIVLYTVFFGTNLFIFIKEGIKWHLSKRKITDIHMLTQKNMR